MLTARCPQRQTRKEQVADFERRQEDALFEIQDALQNQTYQPGPYHSFTIYEPKRRLISAAPFRDRVVHHALCQVIEPIWELRFIHDTYANRAAKGTHRALDRAQEFARNYSFVLQCDIRQFFPSIDHAILSAELRRLIADEKTLWLCETILASGKGVLSEVYQMDWFSGDDLLAAFRPRGLPIGNLTSQFWANVTLNHFDHFIKRDLKCPAYLRYVDDFLLFSDRKEQLWEWRAALVNQLAELRLSLHEDQAEVYPCKTGISFLGFRIYPEYRLVKRRRVVHYRRRLKHILERVKSAPECYPELDRSVQGWINHVRYADSWGLRKAVLDFEIPRMSQ